MENSDNSLKENRIIQMDREFSKFTENSKHFTNMLPDERGALFRVLSSDKRKAAVIKAFDECNVRPELMIVDLVKDEVIHEGTIDHRAAYEDFALSSSGTMIAAVYKQERNSYNHELIQYYRYILAVQKVGSKQKQEYFIPRLAEPLRVAFNKQGTQVIVHGTNYSKTKPYEERVMFSFNSELDQLNLI